MMPGLGEPRHSAGFDQIVRGGHSLEWNSALLQETLQAAALHPKSTLAPRRSSKRTAGERTRQVSGSIEPSSNRFPATYGFQELEWAEKSSSLGIQFTATMAQSWVCEMTVFVP
jgi:hypothetical protein